jgi:hypothetical protein
VTVKTYAALPACLLCAACIVPPQYGYVPPSSPQSSMMDSARAFSARFVEDCPLPDPLSFNHAVQLRAPGEAPAPVTPAILREWVDGCAIMRFTVDDRNHVASVSTVSESAPGVGVPAADILRLNRFANTGDAGPGSPMLIRVGMAHLATGTFVQLGFR